MKLELQLPTSWNELSVRQCLTAYSIIMSDTGRLLEEQELVPAKRILLFQALSGISDNQLASWRASCLEEDPEHGNQLFLADLDAALQSTNFLFEIEDLPAYQGENEKGGYAIALTRTKNPFPAFDRTKRKGKKRTYYAPADLEWFGHMEFLELCTTFTLFEQYIKDYDDDLLHDLLAVLYRPHKQRTKENRAKAYGGDRRQPYLHHENGTHKRKAHMATLDSRVKQIIVFWFASCRQAIIEQYPDLFNNPEGDSSKYGWGGLLMAMAGGLPHLDTVSAQPATDALTYLDYLQEQVKKQDTQDA